VREGFRARVAPDWETWVDPNRCCSLADMATLLPPRRLLAVLRNEVRFEYRDSCRETVRCIGAPASTPAAGEMGGVLVREFSSCCGEKPNYHKVTAEEKLEAILEASYSRTSDPWRIDRRLRYPVVRLRSIE
jgi:hypothetical protein